MYFGKGWSQMIKSNSKDIKLINMAFNQDNFN